jgi:hypothetical protein
MADPACRAGHDWRPVGDVGVAGSLRLGVREDQDAEICARCNLLAIRKPKPIPPEVHFRRADELAAAAVAPVVSDEDPVDELHPDDVADRPGRRAP